MRAQVHADLMGAAGVNRDSGQRQDAAEVLGADDARHRLAASPRARRRGAIFFRFAGSRPIGASMRRPACTSPQTSAMYSFSTSRSAKLARELLVRRVVLGDHHQPRRAAIEPVHDAGPLFAADAAEIVDVVEQRVHQRAAGVARGRMHDHPGRLVDDDQIVILVDDRQRQRFGPRDRIDRFGHVDRIACPALTCWLALAALPATSTWPSLISRWICDREWSGRTDDQKAIEPGAVAVVGDGEGVNRHRGSDGRAAITAARPPSARLFGSGVDDARQIHEHHDRQRRQHDRDELRRREHADRPALVAADRTR